jgi:hypothetical protein
MSVENSQGNNPPGLHNTLKPVDQLIVASANVIDQKGQLHVDGNGPFFDADWHDETFQRYMVLQMRTPSEPWKATTYSLQVHHRDATNPSEYFSYDLNLRHVHVCDEHWTERDGENHEEVIPALLRYLASCADLTPDENQAFLDIMIHNKIRDPRRLAKIRRFAAAVIQGLGKAYIG